MNLDDPEPKVSANSICRQDETKQLEESKHVSKQSENQKKALVLPIGFAVERKLKKHIHHA